MTSLVWLSTIVGLGAGVVAWNERRARRLERERHARALASQREECATELRAQRERTAVLFDRMVEGIIVVGPDARLRLANKSAGSLFGFDPTAEGRSILEATRHHEIAALVTRLETEPEVLNHELRIDRVAETRSFAVNALAVRRADGALDGAILVFHDLTRVRQLEAMRQEFVANVSHELRTPLSLIKSAAETLLDGGKNDPAVTSRFLQVIDKHANRLTLLIDDLLLLSRLDSGHLQLNRQPVLLRAVAHEALEDAAVLARGRGVMLDNRVDHRLVILADPERLRQVLANLIDNAIKYGRPGGHVSLDGEPAPAGGATLFVRDDGPGIPAEAQPRIFERFYRVDRARSREQGGTGLGLAIVKNVVQAHGGEVSVTSTPQTGTEFRITLPRASPGTDSTKQAAAA